MFLALLVFLLTTLLYGLLLWFVIWWALRRLQKIPNGIKALAAALVPLFEKAKEKAVEETQEAEPQEAASVTNGTSNTW